MADFPTQKMKEKNIPGQAGHKGNVIDSGIEGRSLPDGSLSTYNRKNKKGAGNVGNTNVNHV